jgi:hypothetical protein
MQEIVDEIVHHHHKADGGRCRGYQRFTVVNRQVRWEGNRAWMAVHHKAMLEARGSAKRNEANETVVHQIVDWEARPAVAQRYDRNAGTRPAGRVVDFRKSPRLDRNPQLSDRESDNTPPTRG